MCMGLRQKILIKNDDDADTKLVNNENINYNEPCSIEKMDNFPSNFHSVYINHKITIPRKQYSHRFFEIIKYSYSNNE
jgi:hypothetical protein